MGHFQVSVFMENTCTRSPDCVFPEFHRRFFACIPLQILYFTGLASYFLGKCSRKVLIMQIFMAKIHFFVSTLGITIS